MIKKAKRRRKPKTHFDNRGENEEKFERPPLSAGPTDLSLSEPAKIQTRLTNETLTGKAPHPEYLKKGPIITQSMFQRWTPDLLDIPARPVRQTRNPNPQYVD